MAMGAMPNPIQQKVNESHITLVLETAKQTGQNDFELKKQQQKNDFWQAISDRAFELILLFVFVGVIVFSILQKSANNPDPHSYWCWRIVYRATCWNRVWKG